MFVPEKSLHCHWKIVQYKRKWKKKKHYSILWSYQRTFGGTWLPSDGQQGKLHPNHPDSIIQYIQVQCQKWCLQTKINKNCISGLTVVVLSFFLSTCITIIPLTYVIDWYSEGSPYSASPYSRLLILCMRFLNKIQASVLLMTANR